jgi:beta-lactamase regulating signal transducer with metallopeptidase domain
MKEWIITSSVLILIILSLRYLLKGKISLRLQYGLWVLVLLRLIIPINFWQSRASVMNLIYSDSHSTKIRTEISEHIPIMVEVPLTAKGNIDNIPDIETTSTYNADMPINKYNRFSNPEQIAKVIWLIGVATMGVCLLIFNIRFYHRLKRTRCKTDITGYSLPIYKTGIIATPCMCGLLNPAIYITPEVLKNETALKYVLEHEMTHWQHKDHVWSLFRCICLALHWYNPLVWLAASYSTRDAELSSDEATIQRVGEDSRMEYGKVLVDLTRIKRDAGTLLVSATTMIGNKRSIKERIELITKKPKTTFYTLIAVLLIAVIAIGCTFTGIVKNEEAEKEDRIVPLTEEEIEWYNEKFKPLIFDEQGNATINIYSYFFTSFYDRPEDINLAQFLRHFSLEEKITDETEFEVLKKATNWYFDADMTLEYVRDRHVPIHKFTSDTINKVLQKYANITLDDLNGIGIEDLIYLNEYDAYYNFTSDFAAGTFHCTHGEIQGDIVRLFNEAVVLSLKKQDDDYLFISHQRIEKGITIPPYHNSVGEQVNEINREDISKYSKEGIYIPGDAVIYLEKKEFDNPSLFINNELQTIFDKYKETFDDELLKDLWPMDVLRLYNKAIEEENFEVAVNLTILLPEINKGNFIKELQNDKVSKQNHKLQLEKYSQFNGKVIEIIVSESKAYVIIQGDGFWRFEKTENGIWKLGWLSRQ